MHLTEWSWENAIDELHVTVFFQTCERGKSFLLQADEERLVAHLFSAGSIKLFRGRCNRRSSVICRRRTDTKKGCSPTKRDWGGDNATLEMPDRRVIYDGLSHILRVLILYRSVPGQPDGGSWREGKNEGGPILRPVEIKPPRKVCKFGTKTEPTHSIRPHPACSSTLPPPSIRPNLVTSLVRTARPKTH